ncbi:MAG: cell division protein ZapA [Clostridia bacterium]|nr:cell division protein ZapA [Clostridia bacterium]MBR6620665.1 cell division protein ZapA [Clostridia bacterium]
MDKNKIRLNICGTDYSITTEDDPKYVLALGDELDALLTKTLRENSRLSVTQAAILAALEYADMYKKAEVSADNLRSQIKEYLEDSARSKMDAEIAKREVERLTRELQNVQAKLG